MYEYNSLINIPWLKYTEEEIQVIIGCYFSNLGYHIENTHLSDRANEEGADLICKKNNESIAIAVKIKPNKKDCMQAHELANRKETKKIYVYINTPTKSFNDFRDKYITQIEFWDCKTLNDNFVNNQLYFAANLIFMKHCFFEILKNIRNTLCKFYHKYHNEKPIIEKYNFDKNLFNLLWRLKDDSVMLHKANKFTVMVFNQPIKNTSSDLNKAYLSFFINYLDDLYGNFSNFNENLIELDHLNFTLIKNIVLKTKSRSQWLNFLSANFDPFNLRLLDEKNEMLDIIEKQKLDLKLNKEKQFNTIEEKSKENSVWSAISNNNKLFLTFGLYLEQVIDDLFNEYIDNLKL